MMSSTPVQVRRVARETSRRAELAADLALARKIAILLDSQFRIFGIRIGIDPIIGLIPAVGDMISALVGSYLVYIAYKHRLGKWTIATMVGNLAFDLLVGSVPALGDVFDVAFKAHLRNLQILEKAAGKI